MITYQHETTDGAVWTHRWARSRTSGGRIWEILAGEKWFFIPRGGGRLTSRGGGMRREIFLSTTIGGHFFNVSPPKLTFLRIFLKHIKNLGRLRRPAGGGGTVAKKHFWPRREHFFGTSGGKGVITPHSPHLPTYECGVLWGSIPPSYGLMGGGRAQFGAIIGNTAAAAAFQSESSA